MDPDLERLRFLLVALRETETPPDTERRRLAAFRRLWPSRRTEDGAKPGEEQVGPHRGQVSVIERTSKARPPLSEVVEVRARLRIKDPILVRAVPPARCLWVSLSPAERGRIHPR